MNEDKIIINAEGEEINLSGLANKYGSYDFEGKTYYATAYMDYSNDVFPGWYGDAEEGEEYTDEFSAPGVDERGNAVIIYMRFNVVRGEEPEDLSNYDWYKDAHRILYV